MGMVAKKAHQKGSTKSARRPRTKKTIQKIFFCIGGIVGVLRRRRERLSSFARLDSRGRLSPHKPGAVSAYRGGSPYINSPSCSRLADCEKLIVSSYFLWQLWQRHELYSRRFGMRI